MRAGHLANETTLDLLEKFVELAVSKGEAVMGGENSKVGRLYWEIDAIKQELKTRDGDQRRLLSSLYNHLDPSVRLEAATATLAVFPDAARRLLKSIWDRDEFPFAGDAGMLLHYVETGFFKPT